MRLTYQAWDKGGKLVSDTIDAPDAEDARESLRQRGLFVTQIDEAAMMQDAAQLAGRKWRKKKGKTARLKVLANFCQQLYLMIKTGTPIVQSLEAVERQSRDVHVRAMITRVRLRVEEGESLAVAMEEEPNYFDPVTRNLIDAGETSGKLPYMLERVGALTRKQLGVRNKVAGALVYPALLMVVAIGVAILMMVLVLPRFGQLFEDLDVPLPPTTAILMDGSAWAREFWWLALAGVFACVFALVKWTRTPSGKQLTDRLVLRVPGVGKIIRNFATARIARLVGTLRESYLPLLDVLDLVGQTSANTQYQKMLENAKTAVSQGKPMSSAFGDDRLVNPTVYEAMRSGEETGQIGPLLLSLAEVLDEENDVVVKTLTNVLEPIILVFLGILIGFVAISLFMPVFDLMSNAM